MLVLKKEFLEKIIAQSIQESPYEACGILAGEKERVKKVYPMINRDKSAERFFMEPKEQLRVMKEIRGLGLEMLGIYHSHLVTEAYPSKTDIELAYYQDASYVIVSLKDKVNPVIRSFKIIEGRITEEEVKIE
jgi:proteasome lid subunit RPN8/RPN11